MPGHWERCIAMSKEPIVWLFSDDDLMPCDGIERILKVLDKCGERNIMLRFPLALIDGGNNVIYENSPFTDEMISGYNFYWTNWKAEFILLLVNMFLAVMFTKR